MRITDKMRELQRQLVLRESPFSEDQCLHVAQCLPLGRACVRGVL